MKPNDTFQNLPKNFWASVRLISQEVGYTEKKTGQIKIPSADQIEFRLEKFGIDSNRLLAQKAGTRKFGTLLEDYFSYRADVLNGYAEPRLMDAKRAKAVFKSHFSKFQPTRPIPMNKQKGTKKAPAYLTGLVNMLI